MFKSNEELTNEKARGIKRYSTSLSKTHKIYKDEQSTLNGVVDTKVSIEVFEESMGQFITVLEDASNDLEEVGKEFRKLDAEVSKSLSKISRE